MDAYLRGVAAPSSTTSTRPSTTPARAARPGARRRAGRFWVASASGPGRQTVDWDVEGGHWSVVTMNADGYRRVVVDADVGAKVGWFLWAALGLFVAGLGLAVGGGPMIAMAARRPRDSGA